MRPRGKISISGKKLARDSPQCRLQTEILYYRFYVPRLSRSKMATRALCNDTDYRAATTIKENHMSMKGEIKEGAGFVKEELNEHGKDSKSQQKAQEGRDLRNEGRVEDGKEPKTTKPGTGHPEK
jgi:hypothetical protein